MPNPSGAMRNFAAMFPLLAVSIWAGNTIVAKMAAVVVEPAAISFYRWLIAGVILTPFLLKSTCKSARIIKPHLFKLFVLSLLGMVVYQGFSYVAGKTTSATNMGVIIAMMPLMSAILGMLFAGEAMASRVFAGGIVSVLGVVFLISRGNPANLLQTGVNLGDALMLAATLAYAAYGVLLKRWAIPLPVWQSLYIQIIFAVICLLPWYLLSPASPITKKNISLIVYAALLASMFAPWLWMKGVQLMGPGRVSLFMNLLPILVALIAMLLLNEPLHDYHLFGGLAALAGVWLGQNRITPAIAAQSKTV